MIKKKKLIGQHLCKINVILSLLGLCNKIAGLSADLTCWRASRFMVVCSVSSDVLSLFPCSCVSAIGVIDSVGGGGGQKCPMRQVNGFRLLTPEVLDQNQLTSC